MGRRTIVQDDMTGAELLDGTESTIVTVDGTEYSVDLGTSSKEHFIKWLSGDGPYAFRTAASSNSTSSTRSTSGARGRRSVDTYGYDFKTVRDWAVKNKVTAKSGAPITEATRVLNQDVYDAYKAAQA